MAALASLVGIVNLLRGGGESLLKRTEEGSHERAALGVMKTYFLLKDLAAEADALFLEAGEEPAATLSAMEPEAAVAVLARWNEILNHQTARLLTLQELLVGQHHLEIVDPELREKIDAIIGSKFDSVQTLEQLGAQLFFRNMLGNNRDQQSTVDYVLTLGGSETDSLDLPRLRQEIDGLREALERYQAVANRLVGAKEMLKLSKKAREETEL
jgi:hypothetical protein